MQIKLAAPWLTLACRALHNRNKPGLAALALAIWATIGTVESALAACAPDGLGAAAPFQEVTAQGDVLLSDGRRLRLAGIDWPLAPAARARLRAEVSALLGGEQVMVAQAAAQDRWRRIPAQLFIAQPGRDPQWLQGELIENGLVHAWPEPAARACREALAERAMLARTGRLGLWSALGRRGLKGLSAPDAARRMPPRLVYEAQVRSVRSGRAVTFVNFAGPRGATPSLWLTRARMQEFRRLGRDPATFAGKHIRVYAETDGGIPPRLSIASADEIEVIE